MPHHLSFSDSSAIHPLELPLPPEREMPMAMGARALTSKTNRPEDLLDPICPFLPLPFHPELVARRVHQVRSGAHHDHGHAGVVERQRTRTEG